MARDPAKYIFGGVRYPSVTEILTFSGWDDYSRVDAAVLKNAADRGSFCHEWSERYDANLVTVEEVPEPYDGYAHSYERFVREHDYQILHSEIVVRSHRQRYAGQCDRICILDGRLTILDLKTANEEQGKPSWGLQTAAYALAYLEEYGDALVKKYPYFANEPMIRATLCLHFSGVPRLQFWVSEHDYTYFEFAAATVNAQLDAGVIQIPQETTEEPGQETLAMQLLRALPDLPTAGRA